MTEINCKNLSIKRYIFQIRWVSNQNTSRIWKYVYKHHNWILPKVQFLMLKCALYPKQWAADMIQYVVINETVHVIVGRVTLSKLRLKVKVPKKEYFCRGNSIPLTTRWKELGCHKNAQCRVLSKKYAKGESMWKNWWNNH